jgi:PBP1b-binding outer membrane lipoprotein LpoB
MADWNSASTALVNEILASGAIDKTGLELPAKIKVSRVINRTSNAIDTELLTNQICIALNNSGKAIAVSDDATTNELAQYEAKRQGKTIALPKLTITGKIIEVRESNSDLKEVTYTFFLQVNYLGKSIWMGQKQIAKQSTKSAFGF